MSQRVVLGILAGGVVLVGLIGTYDSVVAPTWRVLDPLLPAFTFFGPFVLAVGVVLLYVAWATSDLRATSKMVPTAVAGCFLGMVATFLLMLALASLLDSIFGGPGLGAMVFYLSFILSPVAGVVGGFLGARIAKRGGLKQGRI
jgi:hypothetical protein